MSLKRTIIAAFADVPQPSRDNITRCPYNCSECRRVAEHFAGTTSTSHSVEDLIAHHGAINAFTPEAFQYFLPAYMNASFDSYTKGDVIPDAIRFYFEYSHEARSHFNVKMSRFSEAQRNAIVDYLVHMESLGAGAADMAIELLNDDDAFV